MNNKRLASPTIYDIAKLANVSPGTASRALNNVGYVKEETKQRVEKAAKEMQYVPNRTASSLKTKKTGLVLFAIPDMDNPFYFDLIRAVQEVVRHNGYSLILYYTELKLSEECKVFKMLREGIADGMIMISPNINTKINDHIKQVNCPMVFSSIGVSEVGGRDEDRFDFVSADTRKGIYLSTKHMIRQGHERIAYLACDKNVGVFEERYHGYLEAMNEAGITVDDSLVNWGHYTERSGYEETIELIESKNPPTAICAANDIMILGAQRACQEAGLRIPEDIALIGMDNIDTVTRVTPKLSSVFIAQYEVGQKAAELLFDRIYKKETGKSKKIIFEPRLVLRESSVKYR